MVIDFGREICGRIDDAQTREWIVTNGTGSYASCTVAGVLTRGYHGLLVAALKPPVARTVLLSKLDETVSYRGITYPLFTNRWANGTLDPQGHCNIERFYLDDSVPVWQFACADALIEKRIWMQPGADTTYIHFTVLRATSPLTLAIKALANYRDHHSRTHAGNWKMDVAPVTNGVRVTAYDGATPFFLLTDRAGATVTNEWYYGLELAAERERGLDDTDDVLHAATFQAELAPGGALTFVASLDANPNLNGRKALDERLAYEELEVLAKWQAAAPPIADAAPGWVRQLVLAADQFIVKRAPPQDPQGQTSPQDLKGQTVIAGYHWFTDWGRDTMISLPGLTLTTGRPEIAAGILRTFAKFVNGGMLPNRFPDDGSAPTEDYYNTVDATLWFFQAIRQYVDTTKDTELLRNLYPVLMKIIAAHQDGTRYDIHLDHTDGLLSAGRLSAGQADVQLTWMDAKVGDWVVTPRIGKPVEVNALWYNALTTMAVFARQLNRPADEYNGYKDLAAKARAGFARFWNAELGYCFDVLDGPDKKNDSSLRPNQLFAVSLPESPLSPAQQRAVVDVCAQRLLVSNALRSLAPDDQQYQGRYGGDQQHRDGAYHQGTAWAWLLGVFVLAHLRVYGDPDQASAFLAPIERHLADAGLGTISEIFDGDAPMTPRGCIAQAWSVAEVLRAWTATQKIRALRSEH